MKRIMTKIFKYFLQGLLYVVPIAVTVYVLWEVVVLLDGIIPLDIPGLGILIIFSFVTMIGVIGRHFISEQIVEIIEGYIKRAALVNLIYTAVKDLLKAFVGDQKSFKKPVVVKFTEDTEVRRLGYMTNENFKNLTNKGDLVTVYIPHSYNISGNVYLVPDRYVEPLDIHPSELMKYTVSGGVTQISEND